MITGSKVQSLTKYLLIIIIAALITVIIYRFSCDQKKINILKEKNKSMTNEIKILQDSLFNIVQNLDYYPGLNNEQINFLKNLGLKDPLNDIKNDLVKHPELIPYKGVLGGTMTFFSKKYINIINLKYVSAYFEDGHIAGSMILKYDVLNGKISWKVVEASLE